MKKRHTQKRIFFDLNHPADFHFFKHLIGHLQDQGHAFRVMARDKECLHLLLEDAGIAYTSRGRGKHTLLGKYLYALWILVILLMALLRFRPGMAISLSSPYLVLVSRLLGIPCITFDDTDNNPRLLPLLKRSTYLLSPANYPHQFHHYHFRLPVLKELAYLHPRLFQAAKGSKGIFFRITRTDSIHHTRASGLDTEAVFQKMQELSRDHRVLLSSETNLPPPENKSIRVADPVRIHRELSGCKAFWGNSATMAAEAAVLGIPAVFVSAEKFAYITELEAYGLLFYFHPDELESSFSQLDLVLAGDLPSGRFREGRKRLLSEKLDMTAFMSWFVEYLPESARILERDPEHVSGFMDSPPGDSGSGEVRPASLHG
ncbi:MAG: DUF354 domain-containing protein [Bacteroidales bacterium]|nr:DUF354 domain-containing protein [Bacteroidales bacterium]